MEEDDSIYNVIIAALVIGIIIVIATLIIAKPKPETFTELYFTDHKSLPRFVPFNSSYSLGFTIANHENSTKDYTFDITKTLYKFNRKCDSPTLYLEESDNVASSKVAFSTDPSLYIKDTNYTVSFDYKVRDGKGTVAYIFKDINNNEKYSIRIDNNKLYATVNNIVHEKELQNSTSIHHIDIAAEPDSLKISVDKKVLFHFSTLNPPVDTGVPVILYNSYGKPSSVNLSGINNDISYLKENGFETITLKEYYAWKNFNTIPLPKKPIVIVFDQDYRNLVNNLSESNLKVVIGLTTGTASRYSQNYLTWKDLKELEAKGWEIASSSETASDLLALDNIERYDQFNKSKADIEKYLSSAPLTFIYPQNRYNSTIEAECKSFYQICLSSVKPSESITGDIIATEITASDNLKSLFEKEKTSALYIENKTNWNTKGFIELQLIETYADISNFVVNHNSEKQYIRVTHADTEYNNLELIKEELVIPGSEFYFLDNPLDFC